RGTFLTQLVMAALAQIVARTILWQVVQEVRKRERWRGASLIMLTMPGVGRPTDLHERLSTPCEANLRRYELGRTIDGSLCEDRFDKQVEEIRRECRSLPIDAILIVFGADNMELVGRAVAALSELPVRIQLLPTGMADLMQRSRIRSCGRLNVLELFCGPCSLRDLFLKRSMDIVASLSLGVLLSPLFAIVAILIKLETRGPVLFRQTRHGFNNEPIKVLK